MSKGDKATRDRAIPFELTQVKGSNFNNFPLTDPLDYFLFTRTDLGDMVECYLLLEITAPSDQDAELKVAIGEPTTDDSGNPHPTPAEMSSSYIDNSHAAITGQPDALNIPQGTSTIFEYNLLPHLKSHDESPHGVILIVDWQGSYSYNLGLAIGIDISASAQIGLKDK